MKHLSNFPRRATNRGFSLVELMIALTIGSIIATALVIVFYNVMQSNKEQFKAAQQIENGRFAIDLLTDDLRLAGYYGEFTARPPLPSTLPDPCALPDDVEIVETTTDNPFGLHVQGYAAASLTARPTVPAACATFLDNATLRPGSDILVVRRLNTKALLDPPTTATSVTPVEGLVYAQTNAEKMVIHYGGNAAIDGTKKADGTASSADRKDYSKCPGDLTPTGTPLACPATAAARPRTAAYIRKVHIHVYFVANCRKGSGSNGKCTSADDSIPTLKRLEWDAGGSTAGIMTMVPLAEGIEFLKIRYGIDNASGISGKTQDGSVDTLIPASSVTLTAGDDQSNWQNVVQLDIRLLARNNESTANHTDNKTYDLGGTTYTPSGADLSYKRHVFTSQVYIMNIGGRRES